MSGVDAIEHAGYRAPSRLGRERAGDLQAPLVAVGQVPGELVLLSAEADEGEQLARSRASPGLFRDHRRRPEHGAEDGGGEAAMLADQRVLEHGHVRKESDRLKGARDAAGHDGVGAEPDDAGPVEGYAPRVGPD